MHPELDQPRLLAHMRADYEFARRTFALVPPHRLEEPGVIGPWTVKDIIAHLAAWHRRTLRWIEGARRGEGVAGSHPIQPEPGYGWHEFDAINAAQYQADRAMTVEAALAAFAETFEALYSITAASSEAELFGRAGLSAFFRDPLVNYLHGNTCDHYGVHLPELRQWITNHIG